MIPENRLCLTGRILERESIRYTPAGIPVISARLGHRSQQPEAGTDRNVEFEMPAIVIGDMTGKFEKLATDTFYRFTGFMAAKSFKSKSLLFHITGFSSIE
ncbi:primosomal replication protein N [Oxalobacter aliiformigenes]|uniref:Replication restart protein PriB n=1 Tax=Oxalobacter aliiformigenes TaxID=2946593 RepID=A0ABY7JPR6_9BURK|nr:primosomal replication protein N [Oxalobacter aliiformigenes]WAV94240.1 primosomal replication protein N [Oxalobacter aliiformigenes]WAV96169.1 primosomal replication protein N [Oxalobacter aliiformigenes]WAV98204.1 primosomal replication protein N [Oxalobacter aliiformigenes]